jgi:hypothetical protein
MSKKSSPRRQAPAVRYNRLLCPVPPGSVEYQIFRLEGLFQSLQDLWLAATNGGYDAAGMLAAYRRMQAITGAGRLDDVPADTWFIKPSLVLGGMICNEAISALQAAESTEPAAHSGPETEACLVQLRNLLIALHDLLEVNAYHEGYPIEKDAAHRELASLLGRSKRVSQTELIHACFAAGSELATKAIATLQDAKQPG